MSIDIELSRGQGLEQMRLGALGILGNVENLGTAQSDGAIEADFAQSIGLDHAGEAQRAGGGETGVNANLIVALLELHGI